MKNDKRTGEGHWNVWSLQPLHSLHLLISREEQGLFFVLSSLERQTHLGCYVCLQKGWKHSAHCFGAFSTVREYAVRKRTSFVRSSGLVVAFLLQCCDWLYLTKEKQSFYHFSRTKINTCYDHHHSCWYFKCCCYVTLLYEITSMFCVAVILPLMSKQYQQMLKQYKSAI